PKRIWAEVFAFNRPDRSPEDVGVMIESLAGAGMLFRWEVEGKTWGFWVGINKQGRLPEPSHRSRFLCGPDPPLDAVADYVNRNGSGADKKAARPIDAAGAGAATDGYRANKVGPEGLRGWSGQVLEGYRKGGGGGGVREEREKPSRSGSAEKPAASAVAKKPP